MNALLGAASFLPPLLIGLLLVRLLWSEATATGFILQVFLGIGIGFGVNSLLYFVYLLLFAGSHFFTAIQLAVLVILSLAAVRLRRLGIMSVLPKIGVHYWQIGLAMAAVVIIGLALGGTLTVWGHRPSGTWDAFMIYNRTARFVFRGPADWLQSFSPRLDLVFHADYPLLIPLNIASNWGTLGRESPYVPLFFSGIFMLATCGVLAAALALVKSPWHAAAGLIILLNTPLFLSTGASQTADVPLAFFMLATAALLFLYASREMPGLLTLAGLAAGLAAWTKNEGQLFVLVASAAAALLISKSKAWPHIAAYLAGLATPLLVVGYFKLALAPPNDLLTGGISQSLQSMLDINRHLTILGQYGQELISFGQSWIWIGLVPLAYAVLFGFAPAAGGRRGYAALVLIVVLQMLGYYFVYLITPHPVAWQLEFSLDRLALHVYPIMLFIWFALVTDVSAALGGAPAAAQVTAGSK